jgi:predicted metallopeptidase
MHPNHILSDGNRLMEKLRGKWIDFTDGIVRAIAKELLHIRQEEMKEQLRAHNQREQSREASQQ